MTSAQAQAIDKTFIQRHSGLFARLAFSEMVDILKANGFVDGNPDDVSDQIVRGMWYAYRKAPFTWTDPKDNHPITRPTHQYCSLLSYQGRFTEAVVEVLEQPKSRKSGRVIPLLCSIIRDDPVTNTPAIAGILRAVQADPSTS